MYGCTQIAGVEIDRIHTYRGAWVIWFNPHGKKAKRASYLVRQPLEGHVQIIVFIGI